MGYQQNGAIKLWAEDDQPREKLMRYGSEPLSNAELIAILIGSGTTEESAVELSKRILSGVDNSLLKLGKLSIGDLMRYRGIGEAKAVSIVAALELGRRRRGSEVPKLTVIQSSYSAYEMILPKIADREHEEFWVMYLNKRMAVKHIDCLSRGGIEQTSADIRILFKKALEQLATGLIICHNHPSGNLKPSPQDLMTTKKMVNAGKMLDIPIYDHLIVTDAGYYSFADEGKL